MERLNREKAVSEQQFEKVKLGFEAAHAQLQQAQAVMNLARHQLDVSIMKAPFSGVIASRNVEIGDVINPMMGGIGPKSGILTLMDFSHVKVFVDISLKEIVRIKKGQAAFLEISAFPGQTFPGKVAVVNKFAFLTDCRFSIFSPSIRTALLLRPNVFGEVGIEVSSQDNALAIPQKALLENRFVFLVENSRAVKREVVLGIQNTSLVEIVQGLKSGDLVIVEGNFGLEEGAEVKIDEEPGQ